MTIDQRNDVLPRTTWNALRDRGIFHHPSHGDAVAWSVRQIVAFLRREQKLALQMALVVTRGGRVHGDLSKRNGLVERVTQFDPGPIA